MGRRASQWVLLAASVAGVVGLGLVMQRVGKPMDDRGHGIVAFEKAGTEAEARRIMADWGEEGRRAARRQTYLDFGWLVLYGTALATGCVLVAGSARRRPVVVVGRLLALGSVAAAALDAVENVAMLQVLDGRFGGWPALARRCALGKFTLAGLAGAYAVLGLAVLGISRAMRRGASLTASR